MVFGNRRITLHGLRSGCAISLAMSGVDLQTVMDHVGWETSNTARHYLRMEQVLKSGEAGDSLAELPLDLVELYRKQNELTGFTRAFEMGLGRVGAEGWTHHFKLAHWRGQRPSKCSKY